MTGCAQRMKLIETSSSSTANKKNRRAFKKRVYLTKTIKWQAASDDKRVKVGRFFYSLVYFFIMFLIVFGGAVKGFICFIVFHFYIIENESRKLVHSVYIGTSRVPQKIITENIVEKDK